MDAQLSLIMANQAKVHDYMAFTAQKLILNAQKESALYIFSVWTASPVAPCSETIKN